MYIIERFEDEIAVIEDGEKHFDLSRQLLPDTAREGDVIVRNGAAYQVDKVKTTERRAELAALRDRLRRK